jgi:hypothetical protein
MGPLCSSAETQVCHRSYIIAASCIGSPGAPTAASSPITPKKKRTKPKHMKNKVPLKILNMNFQSLKNKKPDLLEIIDYVKPDIIMGTETWHDRNIVMVCVFVCHMFSYHSIYFDFHSARIILDVSSGLYF